MEFLGVTVFSALAHSGSRAQLSIPPESVEKLSGGIEEMIDGNAAFLAQLRRRVGKLNFALTSVTWKVGGDLRPLYGTVMKGAVSWAKGPDGP